MNLVLQKIVKLALLSIIFVLLVATVLFGMQWFANSLINISGATVSLHDGLPANLTQPITSASAAGDANPFSEVTILPPSQEVKEDAVGDLPLPVTPMAHDATLHAESAMSVQVITGSEGVTIQKILFTKNPQEKLPIASLTKLMTALIVLERYDLSQKVTINAQAMSQQGEQGNIKLNQVLTVENLLYITLMESSNRSAYALAQSMGLDDFLAAMNSRAQALGLVDTHFADVAGLDPGSYSTAQDLVTLPPVPKARS